MSSTVGMWSPLLIFLLTGTLGKYYNFRLKICSELALVFSVAMPPGLVSDGYRIVGMCEIADEVMNIIWGCDGSTEPSPSSLIMAAHLKSHLLAFSRLWNLKHNVKIVQPCLTHVIDLFPPLWTSWNRFEIWHPFVLLCVPPVSVSFNLNSE